jgi:hypothetical protein
LGFISNLSLNLGCLCFLWFVWVIETSEGHGFFSSYLMSQGTYAFIYLFKLHFLSLLEFVVEFSTCSQGLLWCPEICNGEWGKRMWGMLQSFLAFLFFYCLHYTSKSLQVWFSCNLFLRLLWVESLGHSVPNPWNLRMGTWYPLANLLKNILMQLLGMFFLDRSVASYVSLVDCSCSLFVSICSWLVFLYLIGFLFSL